MTVRDGRKEVLTMSSLTSSGKLFLVLTAPNSEFHPIYSRLHISVDP